MIAVGAFDTKTYLSTLLERAAQASKTAITLHGKSIVQLVPVTVADRYLVDHAIS
jgi:antitoxin (DNA-binding transcriptional repressor) of toxin-antitoxin stability system